MDFQFTPEQELFRQSVREFADRYIRPRIKEMEEEKDVPHDLIQRMAEQGFYGLRYAEELGGQGADNVMFAIFNEEMARCYMSVAARAMMQCLMGTEFINLYGTEEQKRKFLIPAIKGERYGTMCMTEPAGGTDLGAMQTVAVRDGDEYVITGQKNWITGAHAVDFFTVAAKTDPEAGFRGVDLFLVEKDLPGVEVGERIDKLIAFASGCFDLYFNDVRVPADHLFGGEEGKGFTLLRSILNDIRVHTAALGLGIAQAAYEESLEYAKQRVAYGRPIIKWQAIQHKLARMRIDIDAARLMIYNAAWRMDQGLPVNIEAATAKWFITEAVLRIVDDATRIFGAYGASMDMNIQRYFRDARWLLYGAGTQTMILNIIGAEIRRQ
ncbi:MAG: acyl-CoA dehydrogenase [Chloroflexi bacterium B3_Chlor]|nr:MAG: acyl-CoA dehydrogenase [Chloroflexi bacterium B3_Chlor]